ncbi:MAG TPA: substrate-binding domain-containing protein [Gemmatimonadales bacterium]|nr:substrate-binding domain-containing protein [Gemmatimonadales bacterium]
MGKVVNRWSLAFGAALLSVHPSARLSAQSTEIILATTTSTRDTGLLDSLLPVFEKRTGYTVKVIAVGSGQALAMGRRGDADLVLSHAPEEERLLTDSGYFLNRRLVMHNDFIIVGPAGDPDGLRSTDSAAVAFRKLLGGRAPFISRGDQSGTHQREQKLWKTAGVKPAPGAAWYVESGQGMAATLEMADEKRGYTLTDRGTYLAWKDKLELVPLVQGDGLLFNVYHVLEINPRNAPRVNIRGGKALADFFVAPETQSWIGRFGRAKFGVSLFIPDAGKKDEW